MEAIFSIHSSIVPADICQQNMVLFQPGSSDSPLATPDSPLLALVHLDITLRERHHLGQHWSDLSHAQWRHAPGLRSQELFVKGP